MGWGMGRAGLTRAPAFAALAAVEHGAFSLAYFQQQPVTVHYSSHNAALRYVRDVSESMFFHLAMLIVHARKKEFASQDAEEDV